MKRNILLFAALLTAVGGAADAQIRLPVIFPLRGRAQPPAPPTVAPGVPLTPGALQADLVVKSGSDTVYFSPRGTALDANGIATLTAQARWLVANPFVTVRVEGHGGADDTRDYALAIGDKRANSVRDFLVMQGVAPQRISVLSWGKERPGTMRVGTSVVATGPRVTTVVTSSAVLPPAPVQ
jgi:peptidoglycan-associated lipoprotein